ncbi:MAG: hypothetical protein ACLUNQ_00255 [Oscillospiraceae bacterium]
MYTPEVTELTGPVEDGGLTDIIGSKGAYLGTGFYNSHFLISLPAALPQRQRPL